MQDCTSLQTDNQSSTPPLSFYRPDALPDVQPTAPKHKPEIYIIRKICLYFSIGNGQPKGTNTMPIVSVHFVPYLWGCGGIFSERHKAIEREVFFLYIWTYITIGLQCFDAVGWAAGRASGL